MILVSLNTFGMMIGTQREAMENMIVNHVAKFFIEFLIWEFLCLEF